MRSPILMMLVALTAIGCGSSPTTTRTTAVERSPDARALAAAKSDFGQQRYVSAAKKLQPLMRSKDPEVRARATLYLGRIKARSDIGHGTDMLVKLHRAAKQREVVAEAGYYAGLFAVRAKRCLTARPLLTVVIEANTHQDRRAEAALSLSACEDDPTRLELWNIALEHSTTRKRARKTTAGTFEKLPTAGLSSVIAKFAGTPVARTAARILIGRRDPTVTFESLKAAREQLGQEDPTTPSGIVPPEDVSVTFILPLQGPAQGFGKKLKADFERWAIRLSEDRIKPVQITFANGSDAESIDDAYRSLVGRGELGVVGFFTETTAPLAVKAAQSHDIATLMFTPSDAPNTEDAPTWKIMHTPIHSAKVVAGAAQQSGRRKLLVIRGKDRYGKNHAYWLKRVWENAKEPIFHELVGSPSEYERLAAEAAALDFDALFLPLRSADNGTLLLRYLAQQGIWARNTARDSKPEEGRREILIFAPPEWYKPGTLHQLGSYGHGIHLPVPYAAESSNGVRLHKQLDGQIKPNRLPIFALVLDAMRVIRKLTQVSKAGGVPLKELLAREDYDRGVSVGFDFAGKSAKRIGAVRDLFILKITPSGFRLANDN